MRDPCTQVSKHTCIAKKKDNIPNISERSIKASVLLPLDSLSKFLVVTSRIQKLDTTSIRALKDRVSELPDGTIRVGLQLVDSSEVIDIDRTQQPTASTQTSNIGSRLQQTTQVPSRRRIVRSTVKSLDGTGTVHQCTPSTARNGNTDIGQI